MQEDGLNCFDATEWPAQKVLQGFRKSLLKLSGQCASTFTNLLVNDIIIMSSLIYSDTLTEQSVIVKVTYSCLANKVVSTVPSHRAHLACYSPLSIVIIGSYMNSNTTIQTCHQP